MSAQAVDNKFGFFDLPRELRDEIYDRLSTVSCSAKKPEASVRNKEYLQTLVQSAPAPALLLVSHQFSTEYRERVTPRTVLVLRQLSLGLYYANWHWQAHIPVVFKPDATKCIFELNGFGGLSKILLHVERLKVFQQREGKGRRFEVHSFLWTRGPRLLWPPMENQREGWENAVKRLADLGGLERLQVFWLHWGCIAPAVDAEERTDLIRDCDRAEAKPWGSWTDAQGWQLAEGVLQLPRPADMSVA